jgi:hypothetical protein
LFHVFESDYAKLMYYLLIRRAEGFAYLILSRIAKNHEC